MPLKTSFRRLDDVHPSAYFPMVTAPGTFASRNTRSDVSTMKLVSGPPLAMTDPVMVPAHGYGSGSPRAARSVEVQRCAVQVDVLEFRTGAPMPNVSRREAANRPVHPCRDDVVDDPWIAPAQTSGSSSHRPCSSVGTPSDVFQRTVSARMLRSIAPVGCSPTTPPDHVAGRAGSS